MNERDRSAQMLLPVFKMDVADLVKDNTLAIFNSNSRKHHFSEFAPRLPPKGQVIYGTRPASGSCEDIFSPLTEEENRVEFGDEIEGLETIGRPTNKGILANTGNRVASVK